MDKQQREELLTQIEMFLGIGLLCLLVAAMHWGGNIEGGWGNKTEWIGRAISSVILIVVIGFLLRKQKKRGWLVAIAATAMMWGIFAIASISLPYRAFIGFFVLFAVYSILLVAYYLWSDQTGKVSQRLDKIVHNAVYARQVVWSALLLAGMITTWSEIRNHVSGFWPDIVLIICLPIVLVLLYVWVKGIWQDRRQDS